MAPLPAPAEKPSHRVSDSQSHAKVRPPTQVAVFCAALWPNLQPALTAQTEKETAEAEAKVARTDQEAAETALRLAKETAAEQVSDAEADVETAQKAAKDALEAKADADAALIEARAKQKEAEVERDAAIADEKEAQRQLGLAQQETTTEQQRRRETEADLERSEQNLDDARQQVTGADARLVREGFVSTEEIAASVDDPMVTPHYNARADVTNTSGVSFLSPTTGSLGGWYKTAFVKSERLKTDRLEVYSNVERPGSIQFKASEYNLEYSVVNPQGEVFGRYDLGDDAGAPRDDVAGSSFPRTSVSPKTFDLDHRGITEDEFQGLGSDGPDMNTTIDRHEISADPAETSDSQLGDLGITRAQLRQYISGRAFRDEERYPDRYSAEVSGTLGGASGRYLCSSTSNIQSCTVQNRGSDLNFVGPWTFRPSSATQGVTVEDTVYMYFGWWSRQITEDGTWSFKALHGPAGSRVDNTEISSVTGKATYRGPAAGYYAIYEPASAESEYGDFTATATLNADFDADLVKGTIDQFSGHPDWSLALEGGAITDGGTSGAGNTVTWTIGTTPAVSGDEWEASFYSNLVEDNPQTSANENARTGVMPSGIAGTFSATYDDVGRLTGAFGAHCVDVVCRP